MITGKQNTRISKWLRCYLKKSDLSKISEAVTAAEAKTSGEIIPMVVRRSANVGHVPLVLSLILFSIFLVLMQETLVFDYSEKKIYFIAAGAVISFFVALLLSRITWLQKLLTMPHDQVHDVHVRAELEFYRGHYDKTEGHTGVLLFISLMEKRAVVLADQGIASKLSPETWSEVVKLMTSSLKKRDLASGMADAIQKCGVILAEHFPKNHKNQNEISNQLVIKE